MDNQLLQIQNRTCRIYGTASAEYLLLQMVDEHDLSLIHISAGTIDGKVAVHTCFLRDTKKLSAEHPQHSACMLG